METSEWWSGVVKRAFVLKQSEAFVAWSELKALREENARLLSACELNRKDAERWKNAIYDTLSVSGPGKYKTCAEWVHDVEMRAAGLRRG